MDNITDNHMTVKDYLEETRTMKYEKMLEREDAKAECKDVCVQFLLTSVYFVTHTCG